MSHRENERPTNVCFSSDKLFQSERSSIHGLHIQYLEGKKLSISWKPSQLGENFSFYLIKGISTFLNELQESSQKIEELSLFPTEIQATDEIPNVPLFTEQFSEIVARYPETVALTDQDMQLTYRELDKRSNQLAHHIHNEYGIKKEVSVAVLMNNSAAAFLSLLAILKTGGTYVPVDPSWPAERIEKSLELAEVKLVITQSYHLENLQLTCPIFAMDFQLDMLQESKDSPEIAVLPDSRAYILFTSGTTGTPRGVEVEHSSLANMLHDQKIFMNLQAGDRLAQPYALTFDASLLCMGVSLLTGATLIPMPKEYLSPKKTEAFFNEHKINVASFIPSVLRSLAPSSLGNIKILICGGEKILPTDITQYGAGKRFVNSYGTTETTCCVCTREYNTKTDSTENISVGKPVTGMQVMILDEKKNAMLPGMVGEVWVGGKNLARGYLKSEEETRRCFIQHPYKEKERLYRTGDLGRMTTSGEIEILGRTDRQIKVNGQRIEPVEIETVLAGHPNITVAHVAVLSKEEGMSKVVAFLAVTNQVLSEDIKKYLKKYLPQNWIPNEFVQLDQLPGNTIGKTDTNRLQEMWLESSATGSFPEEKTEIKISGVELQLMELWKELFQREEIDINENFFSYGGHSLLAIQLLSNVQEVFNVEIALGPFLADPTIQFLSSQIGNSETGSSNTLQMVKAPASDFSPITSSQKGFWIQNQLNASSRNHITRCYHIKGNPDLKKLEKALDNLTQRHDAFRMNFQMTPEGEPNAFFGNRKGYHLEERIVEEATIMEAIQKEHHQLFDLENDPLLRIVHFTGNENSYLTFTAHHIAFDGWSIAILLKELQALYDGKELPPLDYNLRDCLYSYDAYTKSEQQIEIRETWKEKLNNYHNKELIKPDVSREISGNQAEHHKTIQLDISGTTYRKLKHFGVENKVSDFPVLLAALAKLMYAESGEEAVRFGTPNAGRLHPEFESQIGCFLNLLVLQFHVTPGDSFYELVNKASDDVIWSMEHSQVGFTDLVNAIGYNTKEGRHPLFDIEIDYRSKQINANPDQLQLGAVALKKFEKVKPSGGKFDFDFLFTEKEDSIQLEICYNEAVFTENTAKRIAENYLNTLEESLNNPAEKLKEITMKELPSEAKKIAERQTEISFTWTKKIGGSFPDLS